jgi:hypothetical protein
MFGGGPTSAEHLIGLVNNEPLFQSSPHRLLLIVCDMVGENAKVENGNKNEFDSLIIINNVVLK